ncbi:proline/sodium symporter PutP [Lachnospiraceae bacterium KM106-2]|nr:proline/sodium symporter PutP [Lachnospiraceae bacterium KM106-2]
MNFSILISMGAYMLLVVAIGIYYGNKNKTSDDYFIGGRGLGPWVTAMSAEASDMSSWLLMGLPGLAYFSGFGEAGWTAIGLVIGTYLNWKIVAARLRKYSQVSNNSITIPDFFSNRYRDQKNILMVISSIMIIIFFTVYTASGFAACGKLFESVFNADYLTAMIVCGLVIIIYTSIGGFLAASTTDLIQGILMSFSIVIVLVIGLKEAGGFYAVIDHITALPGYLSMTNVYDVNTHSSVAYGGLKMLSGLSWGLGYFGVPHVLIRFMAINNSKEIKKSRRIAMVWVVISLAVAVCIGFVGNTLSSQGSLPTLGSVDSERIFIILTNTYLPALLAGIVLSGILAATMSTSDSQLLMVSSSVGTNLYKKIFKKDATDKQVLIISKVTVVVVALLAMVIASDKNSSIFKLVSYAWSGFGAAFGPLVLFSLYWKRTTLKGAIAGMVGGGTLSILWSLFLCKLGGIFEIYELLPSFLFASLLIIVVSLLDTAPSKEIQEEFDSVKHSKF